MVMQEERELCARTVYVANIDKKVDKEDVRVFFQALCGGRSASPMPDRVPAATHVGMCMPPASAARLCMSIMLLQVQSPRSVCSATSTMSAASPLWNSPSTTAPRPRWTAAALYSDCSPSV